MPDVAKKIVWSIGLSIPAAVLSFIIHKVLQAWGVFDPFAEWLGSWLKMYVSPSQAEWTIAGIIALVAYAGLLWGVWRRSHISQVASGVPGGSILAEVEKTDTAGSPRYMTAYEVIHYIADDSKWGNEVRYGPSAQVGTINVRKVPLLEVQVEFKRIAEQGCIRAIGRLDGVGQHVPIPETYWMSATLNPFSLDNRDIGETTPAVPNPDGIPVYKNVRIFQTDVERVWPRLLRRGPK